MHERKRDRKNREEENEDIKRSREAVTMYIGWLGVNPYC